MVTILPKYTGWEAKIEADKSKSRLIMSIALEDAAEDVLPTLKKLCADYGLALALNTDETHYEVRLKA